MGKALYRTYRSKKLSEIVGQEHITQALSNALKSGAISHAYLFTGPRGSGKTSIARILAHEINKLPYTDDATHLDIIEIDAASNRRIDEIRNLRDKVHIVPSSAKFKVYIIDEVHMLTREAFNALLKTLEEPPAHAVFILATTEVHKLPETIVSRTQRFTFKPVDLDKVVEHLRFIAKQEKLTIDDGALELIAEHGEGAFRDSISLLDQARSVGKKVTRSDIESILGVAPTELIAQLLQALYTHQSGQLVQTLQKLYDQGSDAAQIAKQISQILRKDILDAKPTLPHETLFGLLAQLVEVPASSDPKVFLEITLLGAALSGVTMPLAVTPPATGSSPPTPAKPAPIKPAPAIQSVPPAVKTEAAPAPVASNKTKPKADAPVTDPVEVSDPAETAPAPTGTATFDASLWPQLLAAMKKHNTLHSILKSAEPQFSEGTITLAFSFAFHQKRINESRNKEIIAEIAKGLCGEDIAIVCVVSKDKPKPIMPVDGEINHAVKATGVSDAPADTAAETEAHDEDYYIRQAEEEAASRPITAINNIFGGGELLES
jgi:DNA polymerase-3 subunit gamma/tau